MGQALIQRYGLIALSLMTVLSIGLASRQAMASDTEPAIPTFVDVAAEAGITFRHESGASGRHYNPEFTGAGLCAFDYDGDGWVDLYAANGAPLPGFEPAGDPPRNALYRNNTDGTFADVTGSSGTGDTGYGTGCVAGDYDSDGDLDLYVSNFGPNVFYRNNGDGTFTDVTAATGMGDAGWGGGCSFVDFDGDGDLDLYLVNYLIYKPGDEEGSPIPYLVEHLRDLRDVKAYAGPLNFPAAANLLYRNNGDGTFTDVAPESGADDPTGRDMGMAAGDFDNDGDPDFYVADDEGANSLLRNDGPWPGGSFTDIGLFSGTAYDADGSSQSTMGVAFGDYDNDGLLDLATTAFQGEAFSLYRNDGDGFFNDVATSTQTSSVTRPMLGWGVTFADLNCDGYLDLFIATGHVQDGVEDIDASTSTAQPNLLLLNRGNGTFLDASASAGPGLQLLRSSRSCVTLDYDNDGDLDIAIMNKKVLDPPGVAGGIDLLRNENGNQQGHWLIVQLEGGGGEGGSNRGAIGARLEVWAGGSRQIREVRTGTGYQSQNDVRLHVGLGSRAGADSLVVRWPGGRKSVLQSISGDQVLRIREPDSISR